MTAIAAMLFALAVAMSGPAVATPPAGTASSTATPVPRLGEPHPDWLVDGQQLREVLTANASVKVVALSAPADFERGHIPGAAQIDWPDLEIVETSDQRVATWRADVEAKLTALGLSPADSVVIYDPGTLYAARLWWILDQLGHENKRILNGGLAAWTAAGGELEAGPSTARPAAQPYVGTPDETAIATLAEVRQAVDDPGVVLVDARTAGEYAAGHIPGAININFTDNADATGVWKSPDELRVIYEAAGVTPDKMVIPYCLTGVRSADTYFTLRLIGYPRVTLFTGSFKEWSSHPDLAVVSGEAPGTPSG